MPVTSGVTRADQHSQTSGTIAVVGDIVLGGGINSIVARHGPASVIELPQLANADLAIGNLESVATSEGVLGVDKERLVPTYFRTRPETLAVLRAAGIDAVSTANNHAGDYGVDAMLEQLALLDRAGIVHAGSGPTVEDACRPVFLPVGADLRVALFSADATQPAYAVSPEQAGTCHLPLGDVGAWEERFSESIAAAAAQSHAVLFALHWGDDWVTAPSPEKRALGRRLIELGVDAVLGSNAHVLQGIERHEQGVILHDMAHILSDFDRPADSAVFTLELTADGIQAVNIFPVISESGLARLADAPERDRVLGRLASLSAELGLDFAGDRVGLAPGRRDAPPREPERVAELGGGRAPEPATNPPAFCVLTEAPADAAIEPIEMGPLTLVGAAVDAERYYLPELIWVDTYWRIDEPVEEDLWLAPVAQPDGSGDPAWRGGHEPCDWAWPTSRWEPGEIYHDRVGLRPPQGALTALGAIRSFSGLWGPLHLSVAVTDGEAVVERTEHLAEIGLGLPAILLVILLVIAAVIALLAARYVMRRARNARSRRRHAPPTEGI